MAQQSQFEIENVPTLGHGIIEQREIPGRPPTPSTGPHLCVNCLEFSAVVAGQYRKRRHREGTMIVGMNPDEYNEAGHAGPWMLLEWSCDQCNSNWASYLFFNDVFDGRWADPLYSPSKLMARRTGIPSTPPLHRQSQGKYAAETRAGPLPALVESLDPTVQAYDSTWTNYGEETPALLGTLGIPQTSTEGRQWLTPSPVPYARQHGPTSTYMSRRHSSYVRSRPGFHPYATRPDRTTRSHRHDSRSRTRTRTPAVQPEEPRERSLTPSTLDMMHRRGSNFRLDNYSQIRRLGACDRCKARKKQCSPSHHALEGAVARSASGSGSGSAFRESTSG